jgi:hypothetical protein
MSTNDSRYEGCGEEGPLRNIFLAEFHHITGPMIRCQAPKNGVRDTPFKEKRNVLPFHKLCSIKCQSWQAYILPIYSKIINHFPGVH